MGMNVSQTTPTTLNFDLTLGIRDAISATPVLPPDEFVKEDAGQATDDTKTKVNNNAKIAAFAAMGALVAAGVTYVVMRGKNADDLQKAQKEACETINKAREEILNSVRSREKDASDKMSKAVKIENDARKMQDATEVEINKGVEEAQKVYTAELDRLNNAINNSKGSSIDEGLYKALKEQIEKYNLDYDPTVPPVKPREHNSWDNVMEFLPFHSANTRANMKPLNMPEYRWGQNWSFEIPTSSEMKPSKMAQIDFTPFPKRMTNISMDYANSVKWDDDKVARDLLQNFYDGHGQTLDGVKFDITSLPGGKSKVRIEGEGLYTPDKAILLGETSKADDAAAAGNYGEGLKMTVLKILKDKGASEIKIGADGWRVTYDVAKSDIADKNVLQYSLERASKSFDGNYIEFETDSPALTKAIKDGINHFYHSANADFKAADFENALFGIKKLPEDQKGSAYITGQKFEYGKTGEWQGLDGATVFFKEKPPIKGKYGEEIFNPSRDRVALNNDNIKKMTEHFASDARTSKEDVWNALRSLEDDWTSIDDKDKTSNAIIKGLLSAASEKSIKVNFPENYVAVTYNTSPELVQSLIESGYKVCHQEFGYIGMRDIGELMKDIRNHSAFDMTEVQKKKVGLIRTAIQKLAPYLDKDFSPTELSPKVYLFDAKSAKESANYKDTMAEAIVSEGKSNGFWLDRSYLDRGGFAELVGTGLHEITHKVGGDESSDFSYKLTDVLEKVIQASADEQNASFISEWRNMNKLWDEINSTAK